MTVLVTGGTGLIGSNIARMLVEEGRDVIIFDLLPPPKISVLADVVDRIQFEFGTVTDLAKILHVIKDRRVEGIIHCAAVVSTLSNQRPIEVLQVNIIGSANILEAARIAEIGRVVVLSSSSVMGGPEDFVTPRREEDICLPLSGVYPLSKLTCEQLVYTYKQLYKVDSIAVRPRSVFGPGTTRDFLPIVPMVEDAIKGNPIHYKTGGDTVFDFTYVKDFAKGAIQAFDCKSPRYYVYNLSFGKNRTVFQVCDVIRQLFPDLPIEIGPGLWGGVLSKGEQVDTTYRMSRRPPQDITRAREDFKFNPEWDLDRAIPDWVRWITQLKY